MEHQSPSRDTSEETFDSITPLEVPKTPSIEKIESLPLDPTNVYSKSPGGTLKKLTSPFRRMSSEKIRVSPESEHTPENTGEGLKSSEGKKKKSTARKKAGALVRKFSQFRSKKPTQQAEHHDDHEGSLHDDSGSQYGSIEDVEMPLTPEEAEDKPPLPTTPVDLPPPSPSADTEQSLPDIVATEHPVSTLPFAISTWKPKKEPRIEKPVETIGPQDSLRKRITADSPDHSTPTEDEKEPPAKAELLSHLVTLAQSQLSSSPLGAKEPDPPGRSSRSPSPNPDALAQPAQGTTGEVLAGEPEAPPTKEGAEGDNQPAAPSDKPMAPHGDLIQPDPAASGGSAPPVVTGMTAPLQHGPDTRKEHLYKILVIGELGTGKTSIIKRYVHQFFSQHYRATIGVDFALKVMTWDEDTTVRLQLWDIAGQERFGNMTRVYYKEAVGAFIVFDCTRTATFDAIVKWKNDLDSKVQLPDGSNVPCVLLANKCDLHKEGPINNPQRMEDYCKEKGFAGWFETSAKENINIEEATRALVRHILKKDRVIESTGSLDEDRLTIVDDAQQNPPKKCAC